MNEKESTPSLIKEVPGHLFQFEEKIWGMTLQQLLADIGILTGCIMLTQPLSLVVRLLVCMLLMIPALVVIHRRIRGQSLLFWLYLWVRAKTLPSHTIWQPSRASTQPVTSQRQTPSIQATWLPVNRLQQGIMGEEKSYKRLQSARYWMAWEVEGKNIHLLPEQEQTRIFQRFEAFLTGLEFHIQFLSYTEPLDPSTSPALRAQKEALQGLSVTPQLQAFQQASIAQQEQQIVTCTRTRHFVLVSASSMESTLQRSDGTSGSLLSLLGSLFHIKTTQRVSQAQALDQMHIRALRMKKAIQQLEMHIWPLQDEELLRLLAHCLAPGSFSPTFVPELLQEEVSAPSKSAISTIEENAPQVLHLGADVLVPRAAVAAAVPKERKPPTHFPTSAPLLYTKRLKGLHTTVCYKSAHRQASLEADGVPFVDLVAPSRVEICPDLLTIQVKTHVRYIRTFLITDYGHHLQCGWVGELTELGIPMIVSSHFEPLDSHSLQLQLEQHLTKLESQRLADQRAVRIFKADHNIEADQIRTMSHALASKRLKIFHISLTICLHAGSIERLEQRSHALLSHLRDLQIQAHAAILRQDLGWQSCLPTNLDLLQQWIKLPSTVASTFFPATNGTIGTPTGVLLGHTNAGLTSRPIYLNPWSTEKKIANPHMVVIGESGMGKSWLGKTVVTGFLGLGLADVVVLDKDDDYLPLHEALHAESQRYNLARSCPINLFDIPLGPQDIDPDDPADFLSEFFDNTLLTGLSLLLTDEESKLSKQEEAYLIHVARATYASAGLTLETIRENPSLLLHPAPTLADFIIMMKTIPATTLSLQQSLLERLEKAAYLFQGGQTSISLEKPLTIFSIKQLDEKWYALMTYAVQNFLMRHRALQRRKRYLAYVVEEASFLLRHPAGRRYLENNSRGFRKLGIAQITLSQHPRDFLEAGQVVLSNAGTAFFLGMQQNTVEKLHLPKTLEHLLVESIPGQCVMRIGNEYTPLSIWTNPVYAPIFATDP